VHANAQHPGCGDPAVVDMGAFENQEGKAADIRLGDLDGDGFTNTTDMLIMFGEWGVCTDECCLSDLDMNGDTGTSDLLLLLGRWG
jgi:hypothetical protein